MKIIVYSKPNCPQCVATLSRLEKHGLVKGKDFDYRDVSENPVHMEEAQATGHRQMPIVKTDHNIWSGFKMDFIDDLANALAS